MPLIGKVVATGIRPNDAVIFFNLAKMVERERGAQLNQKEINSNMLKDDYLFTIY